MVVGAADAAGIVLAKLGIAPHHADIERNGERVQLLLRTEPARLNGRVVHSVIVIKPCDTIEFAGVRCDVIAAGADAEEDEGRGTCMRKALARYVLRGVSGRLSDAASGCGHADTRPPRGSQALHIRPARRLLRDVEPHRQIDGANILRQPADRDVFDAAFGDCANTLQIDAAGDFQRRTACGERDGLTKHR